MRIVQITDTHVSAEPGATGALIDANEALERAVDVLNGLEPQPDVVLITGDLADRGEPEDYVILAEILDKLVAPTYLIPGNHDDARVLVEQMPTLDYLPRSGHCSYTVEHFPVRLVALDTTDPERHDGVFPEDRARWLDETLSADQRPTLLFMHHPPFDTGIFFMDAIDLKGRDRFRHLIAQHPHVTRIICGHVHRAIQANWGPTSLSICPSTAHQVGLVLSESIPPTITTEPPSYQMHLWNGSSFVTHTNPFVWDGPAIKLGEGIKDWDAAIARLRVRKQHLKASVKL